MICLANDEIRKFAKFISKPDVRTVELYVIPGYDVIETPDGEMGFAVYDAETERIIVPEGLTEEDKERVLSSIAHEYFHHIEHTQGKTNNEEAAEDFARRMVSAFKSETVSESDTEQNRRTESGKTMNDNVYLTIRQIQLMQHALGLDDGRYGRHGIIVTYRNYFDAGERIEAWEELTGKGLAERDIGRDGDIRYKVTQKGIATLERIMLIKIKWR